MEKFLEPKLSKYLDDLQDKVTHNNYKGDYDHEDNKRRRLQGLPPKKYVPSNRGRISVLPLDDEYWTSLAMKKNNIDSAIEAKKMLMSGPS